MILFVMSRIIVLFSWIVDIILAQKCQFDTSILDSIEYVGCFVDSHTRLLPYEVPLGSLTDNTRCILHCRNNGYMFAGTEIGHYCFCGNNPWWYTAADVDPYYIGNLDCDSPCLADSSQICGGGWRLSVYRTGLKNETRTTGHGGIVERWYIRLGMDKKLNDHHTATNSLAVRSMTYCAALCFGDEACNGFVHSAITEMCQLYKLNYGDLCDNILIEEEGSTVYIIQ